MRRGPTKRYAHDGFSGLVETRTCRKTGLPIGIYASVQAGIEVDPELPWSTVCEVHSNVVCHGSLDAARRACATPDWCDACQKMMTIKEKRKTQPPYTVLCEECFHVDPMDSWAVGHLTADDLIFTCPKCGAKKTLSRAVYREQKEPRM